MGIDRQFKARTRTASVSTVIGITLVLVMLGVQGFILYNGKALERSFKEDMVMQVFLKRQLKEADVMRFRKELDAEAFTRQTEYVSPEEAAETLKKDLGEDFLEVLGGVSPIDPNIQLKVALAYAEPDSLRWIAESLRKDERVSEVVYNVEAVENLNANFVTLNIGGLVFLGLLLIVAVALINNTIRLAIYSKRFVIRTMHLVGATRWFIKRPFLMSGLWQGLVASMLAVGVLVGLAQLAKRYVPALLEHTNALSMAMLFGAVLVVGLLIALASTWFAVGRYIRMDHETIHWS
ncbi:MAG: cell division protein FtsX [Flavobacteriales bacterium]|nr:cell division protein FtsX [Flavobacteriales bacterium]